eukprot:7096590-Lingulodinium_polyedra.AAC.1
MHDQAETERNVDSPPRLLVGRDDNVVGGGPQDHREEHGAPEFTASHGGPQKLRAGPPPSSRARGSGK